MKGVSTEGQLSKFIFHGCTRLDDNLSIPGRQLTGKLCVWDGSSASSIKNRCGCS